MPRIGKHVSPRAHHRHPCRSVRIEMQTLWATRLGAADLARLYAVFSPGLRKAAEGVLEERDQAPDIVHDVFAKLSGPIPRYDPERGSVWRWLSTIVHNACVDRNRSAERSARRHRKVLAAEPSSISMEADVFELERVRTALARLPEAQRATLRRAFWQGEPYARIAARDGVAIGTVKVRVFRGLQALRDALGE